MRTVAFLALLGFSTGAAAQLTTYADPLRTGFGDFSYAPPDLANTNPVFGGSTSSIPSDPGVYNGIQFLDTDTHYRYADYQELRFHVHGGATGGQDIVVSIQIDGFANGDEFALTYLD